MSISATQYREMAKPGNKYGAVRSYRCEPCGAAVEPSRPCMVCGAVEQLTFASKGEAKRYDVLRRMQDLGHIRDLECHPRYTVNIEGRKLCVVELDFRYVTKPGQLKLEDFKGKDNALSKLKRKAFELSTGLKVDVIKA